MQVTMTKQEAQTLVWLNHPSKYTLGMVNEFDSFMLIAATLYVLDTILAGCKVGLNIVD